MYQARYGDPLNYEVAENFTAYAEAHKTHPATLAVAWVMSHPGYHRADHRSEERRTIGAITRGG